MIDNGLARRIVPFVEGLAHDAYGLELVLRVEILRVLETILAFLYGIVGVDAPTPSLQAIDLKDYGSVTAHHSPTHCKTHAKRLIRLTR